MPTRLWAILVGGLWAAAAWGQAPLMSGEIGMGGTPMAPGAPDVLMGPPMDPAMALEQGPQVPTSWLKGWFNPQPRFEARAEAIFLKPSFQKTTPLARQTFVDANDSQAKVYNLQVKADEQFIAAPRLALEYHLNEFKSIEAVGYVVDGPNQFLSPRGAGDFPFFLDANAPDPRARGPLTSLPPGFPVRANEVNLNWQLRNQGAELNWLHHFILQQGPCSDMAIGFGGRYFGLVENGTVSFFDIADNTMGVMRARVDNEMGGIQFIGRARWQTPIPWFRAVADAKIGLMANTTERREQVFTSPVGYNAGTRQTETVFSPLFDGNFYFEFFLTRNLTVFSGLQLLYVDRVNRSGGQFVPDVNAFLYPGEKLTGFFQWGPRVGAVFSF